MPVLFIGKRFYTNRDALRERFGRIWQLPWHWAQSDIKTRLWLIDYHSKEAIHEQRGKLQISSTPVRSAAIFKEWRTHSKRRTPATTTVVASGDCYIGLLAYRLARKLKARFIFDVYDKYDEFGGYRTLPGFDLFHFLLNKAEARLFASQALMKELGSSTKTDVLVSNGLDADRFHERNKKESRIALELPLDIPFIGYFGSMEPDRGVDDLIKAVSLLRNDGSNIELLLGGKARPGLDVAQPGVRYLGNVPFERVPLALASCDMLAVPYRRSAFMDAGASNKIVEAIACARPIVATRTPNLTANFPRQSAQLDTLLAEPGNPQDLARAIKGQSTQKIRVDMPDGFGWKDISVGVANALSLQPLAAHQQAGAFAP